jgi:hypothetical protein
MKLTRFADSDTGLVHHYSQTGVPPKPYDMRSYSAGYEKAAQHHLERKRIALEENFVGRVIFTVVWMVAVAAVSATAAWVVVG